MGHCITVIGGGASGMMAALEAASSGARVTLLEKEPRVGKKLLMTGNGRCNLLNSAPLPTAYHGSGAGMAHALIARFPPAFVLRRFEQLGLYVREEGEGRVYPLSGQASSVLDALRLSLDRAGIAVRTGCEAVHVMRGTQGFQIGLSSGETLRAACLVLATGGAAQVRNANGYDLARMLGHSVTSLQPALSQLRTSPQAVRGLKGVRVQARLALYAGQRMLRQEMGEVLFTEYGLSGVAAMQCARMAGDALANGHTVSVHIDLLPDWTEDTIRKALYDRFALLQGEPMAHFFPGLLHKRIGERLLSLAQIDSALPAAQVRGIQKEALATLLKAWPLPLHGVMPLDNAQVTAGGLAADEWSPGTLASRITPGLYATGELLDVDGDCGGYNLLWAWVSGIAAGRHAAMPMKEDI